VQDESKGLVTRIGGAAPQLVSSLLRHVGEARLRVAGSSMLPAIRPADILVIRRVDIARVALGDVVLVAREGRLFAHRVVERVVGADEPVLITRGDAHSRNDPPVTPALLLGRVVALRRNDREMPLQPVLRRQIRIRFSAWLPRWLFSIRRRVRSLVVGGHAA
jgi:hypothetical protein